MRQYILRSPAEIIQNRTGKQCVFLKHYRYLISQYFGIIFANIHAADTDRTVVHIIKAADKIDKAALS